LESPILWGEDGMKTGFSIGSEVAETEIKLRPIKAKMLNI
jgi:hypothetical protein